MKEKRQYKRLKDGARVIYKIMGRKGESTLPVVDISGGGIRLPVNEKLRPGTLLELAISLPGDNKSFFGLAKVIWQLEASSKSGRKTRSKVYETGLQFIKLGIPQRKKVIEYVYQELTDEKKI